MSNGKDAQEQSIGEMMREEFRPAIEALQKDLADQERKVIETKTMINKLCELTGDAPMYADVGQASEPTIANIMSDTFYGKSLSAAAREYLEMRRLANLGPTNPREVFEALQQGGFAFDTKDETNAISGVRQTMRKNSAVFHRLPNGEYGLLAWYPKAKKSKSSDDDTSTSEQKSEDESETNSENQTNNAENDEQSSSAS